MRSQSKKRPIKENRESSGIRIRQCTVYEPDFKKAVVLFAEQKGTSEAKKRYGISESNIRRWRKIENKRREISLGKSIPNMQHMVSKKLKKPSVCDDKLENDIANQLGKLYATLILYFLLLFKIEHQCNEESTTDNYKACKQTYFQRNTNTSM